MITWATHSTEERHLETTWRGLDRRDPKPIHFGRNGPLQKLDADDSAPGTFELQQESLETAEWPAFDVDALTRFQEGPGLDRQT